MTLWQYSDVSEDDAYWRRSTYWLQPPKYRRTKRDIVTFIVPFWEAGYTMTGGTVREGARKNMLLNRAGELFYNKIHIVPLWSLKNRTLRQLQQLESGTDGEPSYQAMISAFAESHLVIASWGQTAGGRRKIAAKTMEFEELAQRKDIYHLGLTVGGHPHGQPIPFHRPERWIPTKTGTYD